MKARFPRPLTARLRAARRLALLAIVLVFGGQSLALTHLHGDEAPGPDCVICGLVKSQVAATTTTLEPPGSATVYALPFTAPLPAPAVACPTCFEARAPPTA